MSQRVVQVDAFADRPFTGNPAAVCVLAGPADEGWMQDVAREMNLSETAFLHPEGGAGEYRLRWFTPVAEVDLCGHATLASAHVLWEDGHIPPDRTARFHTRSGPLTAVFHRSWIELDFPAERPADAAAPAGLVEALGARPVHVARNRFDYLVEVGTAAEVRALDPDQTALAKVEARGVIVTSRADTRSDVDFVSRFFAPRVGVPEDPVTGSAHCCLGPYWAERLGRDDLVGAQLSARGGRVQVRVAGDRVALGGRAVTVMRGELLA